MKRLVATVVAAGAAVAAVAMPTKAELQKAQAMVNDVTAADVASLRAKSKTPAEVAAKHMELAGQAGSEAEKYLLLQAAFKLYAKAGDYDAAANVIEKLQTEISDYDPEVTVELCGTEFIRKMRENAPRLYALKENARRIVFYRKQRPIREAAVKKNPKDAQAQRKLAECHAELGDWPKALDVFVKAGGELKKMSEGETSGKVPAQELGDFWWDYETKSDTQVYKLHAAELYRKALADESFKGLTRTRAEQRVKEVEEVGFVLSQKDKEGGKSQNMSAGLLAHRWSFDKDFVDSVGKVEGRKLGKDVGLVEGRCVCCPGGLDFGKVLENIAGSFTIECWYVEKGRVYGSRVIETGLLGQGGGGQSSIHWATGTGKEGYFNSGKIQPKRGTAEMQFELRHRYYIAVSYNGNEVIAYKADLDGDRCLRSYCAPLEDAWAVDTFRIGVNCADPSGEKGKGLAIADYDEIRIWKTALGKTDIVKSYELGPDKVPAVGSVPSVSLDTFKPKPDSPFQIRGNEATLDLGQGYGKLEFVKCPAGPLNFFLCKHPKEIVKTTISRPFWIMKRPIMRKELQRVLKSEADSADYAALKGDMTFVAVEKFNAIFRKELPSGMVIRLPSLAEFQYAYLADPTDTTEQNDVVSNNAAKRSRFQRDKKSEPNAWGLYDFKGERMCDLFTKDAVELKDDFVWDDVKTHVWFRFKQLDSTVDPLYYGEGQTVRSIQFIPSGPGGMMAQCGSAWAINFRLVIGPDLVSEWKAKHKN